jgi:hypothetical protein
MFASGLAIALLVHMLLLILVGALYLPLRALAVRS